MSSSSSADLNSTQSSAACMEVITPPVKTYDGVVDYDRILSSEESYWRNTFKNYRVSHQKGKSSYGDRNNSMLLQPRLDKNYQLLTIYPPMRGIFVRMYPFGNYAPCWPPGQAYTETDLHKIGYSIRFSGYSELPNRGKSNVFKEFINFRKNFLENLAFEIAFSKDSSFYNQYCFKLDAAFIQQATTAAELLKTSFPADMNLRNLDFEKLAEKKLAEIMAKDPYPFDDTVQKQWLMSICRAFVVNGILDVNIIISKAELLIKKIIPAVQNEIRSQSRSLVQYAMTELVSSDGKTQKIPVPETEHFSLYASVFKKEYVDGGSPQKRKASNSGKNDEEDDAEENEEDKFVDTFIQSLPEVKLMAAENPPWHYRHIPLYYLHREPNGTFVRKQFPSEARVIQDGDLICPMVTLEVLYNTGKNNLISLQEHLVGILVLERRTKIPAWLGEYNNDQPITLNVTAEDWEAIKAAANMEEDPLAKEVAENNKKLLMPPPSEPARLQLLSDVAESQEPQRQSPGIKTPSRIMIPLIQTEEEEEKEMAAFDTAMVMARKKTRSSRE